LVYERAAVGGTAGRFLKWFWPITLSDIAQTAMALDCVRRMWRSRADVLCLLTTFSIWSKSSACEKGERPDAAGSAGGASCRRLVEREPVQPVAAPSVSPREAVSLVEAAGGGDVSPSPQAVEAVPEPAPEPAELVWP